MESAGLIGKMNSSQHCFRGNASGVSPEPGGGEGGGERRTVKMETGWFTAS